MTATKEKSQSAMDLQGSLRAILERDELVADFKQWRAGKRK